MSGIAEFLQAIDGGKKLKMLIVNTGQEEIETLLFSDQVASTQKPLWLNMLPQSQKTHTPFHPPPPPPFLTLAPEETRVGQNTGFHTALQPKILPFKFPHFHFVAKEIVVDVVVVCVCAFRFLVLLLFCCCCCLLLCFPSKYSSNTKCTRMAAMNETYFCVMDSVPPRQDLCD